MKRDRRYERLLVYCYKQSPYASTGYGYDESLKRANRWVEEWIAGNKSEFDCDRMVRFLNKYLPYIEAQYKEPEDYPLPTKGGTPPRRPVASTPRAYQDELIEAA